MKQVVSDIEAQNRGIAEFWSNSAGWAPVEAAVLLSKSRLDWQVSLSTTLHLWVKDQDNSLSDGELILAWVNLGTLVEGTLKTFLSVYLADYQNDIKALLAAGTAKSKWYKSKPDGLTLDPLRLFCIEKKILTPSQADFVERVQQRRNAIHAFRDRNIGDQAELYSYMREYLGLLEFIADLLPYPE